MTRAERIDVAVMVFLVVVFLVSLFGITAVVGGTQ